MRKLILFTLSIVSLGFLLAFNSTSTKSTTKVEWETNYEEALKKAKKENKKILVNFTGSDWCGWCIKLHREVFDKEAFQNYADKNLVLLKLDFPRRKTLPQAEKEQNYKLAKEHNVTGFPTILVLDTKSKVLLRTGYQRGGAEAYVKHLKPYVGK